MTRIGSTHHVLCIVFSFVYALSLSLCAKLQIPSMPRVGCGHHVLGVEHLLRELGHCARPVLRVAPDVQKLFVIAKSDFCRDHES